MSDFPRGWTLFSRLGTGSTPSITSPATPGVVHVLDSLEAELVSIAVGAAFAIITFRASTPSIGAMLDRDLSSSGPPGNGVSLSGLDLASAPGESLTVAFLNVVPVNYDGGLIIQGHDI